MRYFDKNGNEIKAGMYLAMEDGSVQKVYDCMDEDRIPDLGINASNEQWLENQGLEIEIFRELYPLSQFNLRETEIHEPELAQGGVLSPTM